MILDTNALSAVADGNDRLEAILGAADAIIIPVIVLGEYRYGIRGSRNRRQYERWLREFTGSCRVLSIDEATAERYAEVREELKLAGRPIPANDLWIAALARQHGLPLLTRDEHFRFIPQLKRVIW